MTDENKKRIERAIQKSVEDKKLLQDKYRNLAQVSEDTQRDLTNMWVLGEYEKVRNLILFNLKPKFEKLVKQYENDGTGTYLIRSGALLGASETFARLIHEMDEDRHIEGTEYFAERIGIADDMSIIEVIGVLGSITNKDVEKHIKMNEDGMSNNILKFLEILAKEGHILKATRVDSDTIRYSLTDLGVRYVLAREKKKDQVFDLIREIYGCYDCRGNFLENETIHTYLCDIGNKVVTDIEK